jgi:hypothetical protein
MSSREGANPPQLVIVTSGGAAVAPPIPTSPSSPLPALPLPSMALAVLAGLAYVEARRRALDRIGRPAFLISRFDLAEISRPRV